MTPVITIRFKDSGKNHHCDPHDLHDLQPGEIIIVDTARGPEMARVAYPVQDIPPDEILGELRPVIRRATDQDFERMARLHARHDEVLKRCEEKVRAHQLPMNLVKAEYSFDGSRLTFYFTAENRVDFRMLVRDLARTFRSRIELRQIGPRDEARLLGGIGPCGRILCCASFLPDYARVSIKMAKDQDLPLNPSKISGVCGRLLCCLSYEHQQYLDMKANLPARESWVQTPDGPGDVIAVNVLRETVTVRLAGSGMEAEYTRDQIDQATDVVGAVARQRNREGITPATRLDTDTDELEMLRLLDEDGEPAAPVPPTAPPHAGSSQRKKSASRRKHARNPANPAANPATDTAPPSASEQQPSSKPRRRRRKPPPHTAGNDGSDSTT